MALDATGRSEDTARPVDDSAVRRAEAPDAKVGERPFSSTMADSNGLNPAEYIAEYNQRFETGHAKPDKGSAADRDDSKMSERAQPDRHLRHSRADGHSNDGAASTTPATGDNLRASVMVDSHGLNPAEYVQKHNRRLDESTHPRSPMSGIAKTEARSESDTGADTVMATPDHPQATEAKESPPDTSLRADREHKVDKLEVATDYYTNVPPTEYDRYPVRNKENPIPLFDGTPTRDQSRQGDFGDCGIVSTIGAVAAHRPDAIVNAIKQTNDGEFEVKLHAVRPVTSRDLVARPTGDTVTYKITDELPVRTDDPTRPLAGVRAETCSWAALMEKAVASQDQVWSSQQQAEWDTRWKSRDKPDVDAERGALGLGPSPDAAPKGYNRLDVGSTAVQQANLLAEITGSPAEVRRMPEGPQAERLLLDQFSAQLADNKPILVGVRGPKSSSETAPFSPRTFAFGHAYEVTKVDNGDIHVRNPWGDNHNPPPMSAATFMEYFRDHDPTSNRRSGYYATLK